MNILHLAPHLNAGGITSYLRTLAKGQIAAKHTVHIACPEGECIEEFKEMGVKVVLLNMKTKSILSPKVFSSRGKIQKYIKNNDIQIVHAHTRVTQFMANKLKGVVFVSTCHGYFRAHLFRKLFPCWGDATIAISREVVKHLQDDFKVPSDKIALVESGVDLDTFKMATTDQRLERKRDLGISVDKLVIGSIARLSDVKGLDVLIQAIPKILEKRQDFKVLLIGRGKQEQELRDLVKQLKLQDIVIFNDSVAQTAHHLPIYDVFVCPSRSEGLGLSALEAQATGLPVVASNVGGLKSVIENGETGMLVEPENPESLAEVLLQVMYDDPLRAQLSAKARSFIEQRFDSSHMVEKTLNLYARLMV